MEVIKKHILKLLFFICFIILIILLLNAGRFLVVKNTPQKSDVIIIFSGDDGNRTIEGVNLYKEHYANKIIMSGGTVYQDVTMGKLMKDHAIKLGVESEDIITEEKSDSTYENILYSKKLMDQFNFKSAIIVSSDYHMRRIKLTCSKLFKGTNIKLTFCPCEDKNFKPDKWWTNNKSIMLVINEYLKIAGYFVGKYS